MKMYNNKNNSSHSSHSPHRIRHKSKNNRFFLFYICVKYFYYEYAVKPLDQLLTFSVNGDIFTALQKACKDSNINLGILTNRHINFVGHFQEIPLKQLFKIIFDQRIDVSTVGSFILIKDGEAKTKNYEIKVAMNDLQRKSVENFLESLTKNQKDCFYVYNGEDGTILYHGFDNNHKIIEEYVNKINIFYSQQVVLECKIIAISHNKTNNNINFLDLIGSLLGVWKEYESNHSIPVALSHLMGDQRDEMVFITKYLSAHYKVSNIQEIQILIRNKQKTIFQNLETRYADKVYDHKIVPMNISHDNMQKYSSSVIKNVKELKAGMNLKMEATILNNGALLNIDYNQSSFRNKIAHQLPEIMENAFATSIYMVYDRVIVLNGLKTTIHSKKVKNKNKFFLWRWLFEKIEGEEIECQIIFLIRIKKI